MSAISTGTLRDNPLNPLLRMLAPHCQITDDEANGRMVK
jgi:hypothetical protein